MVSLQEAGLRHSAYYKDVLRTTNELYKQGGESIRRGLSLFDQEWANIKMGQAWSAMHAAENAEAAQLCNIYPGAGIYCLNLRQNPHEQIS